MGQATWHCAVCMPLLMWAAGTVPWGDKNFRFTSPTSLQITLTQSYVPVYLRSSTVHAELSSLYIKVIILALVILFPRVAFPS